MKVCYRTNGTWIWETRVSKVKRAIKDLDFFFFIDDVQCVNISHILNSDHFSLEDHDIRRSSIYQYGVRCYLE